MDEHTDDKPKSRKAKKTGPMPTRWHQVIAYMVIDGMVFEDAMRHSGYSESYLKSDGHQIKKDPRFSKALDRELTRGRSKTDDRREKRLRDLDRIIEDPESNDRDVISAVQVQGRMCGWLSETIRHETTERQQLLDDAQKAEAARLAVLALDTRALPGERRLLPAENDKQDAP